MLESQQNWKKNSLRILDSYKVTVKESLLKIFYSGPEVCLIELNYNNALHWQIQFKFLQSEGRTEVKVSLRFQMEVTRWPR